MGDILHPCLSPNLKERISIFYFSVVIILYKKTSLLDKGGYFFIPLFSSVSQLCPSLWDCLMPGFPVHHQPPELAQTHVQWVIDAIQPSRPLLSPFPPAFNLPSIRVFSMSQFFASGGQSIGASASASVLPMNIQDWFPLGWAGWIFLQSKGLSRVFSNTTVQKDWFKSNSIQNQFKFYS